MSKSKRGIVQQISKRFETTIIGALARFEDSFGYLWGQNSNRDLTDKQQEFLDMWEVVRTSILNHGNNQMRAALDDIINHIDEEHEYYKYKITLFNQPPTIEEDNIGEKK